MARIVADRGWQLHPERGAGRYMSFEMDCGCEIRIDERMYLSGTRASGVDLRDRLSRVAAAHDCEVIVHHAPEKQRREIRQRRRPETEPIRYMGMDFASRDDDWTSVWLRAWDPWRAGDPRPARSRGQPVPATPPEQAVRQAAERLRGLQVSSVVIDEVSTIAHKPTKPEPSKKPEDQHRDRFELIELT